MSTLGVSSSSGTNPYAYLQSLRVASNGSQVQGRSAVSGSPDSDSENSSSSTQQVAGNGGGHRRHHHKGEGGMMGKVQDAVTSALQAAQSDPSADPNQTIQDAVAKVFQQNGNGQSGGERDGDGDHDGTQAASANGTTAAASPAQGTSETGPSKMQGFFQTLQDQYGISAEQFRQDFQSAVQQARGGQSDSSLAFRSFPPGTFVDTAA